MHDETPAPRRGDPTPKELRAQLMARLKELFDAAESGCMYFDEFRDSLRAADIKLADLNSGAYVGVGKLRNCAKRAERAEAKVTQLTAELAHDNAATPHNAAD